MNLTFSVQVSRHHDGDHSEKEDKSPVPGIFEGTISDFPQCMQKVNKIQNSACGRAHVMANSQQIFV